MIVDSNETITAKYNISVIKVLELKERFCIVSNIISCLDT